MYFHRASWQSSATLTEVLTCFFLSCKANARVEPAKMGQGRTLPNTCVVICIICFMSFCVLCVCKCVLYNCHRVATKLQLTNISNKFRSSDKFESPMLYYSSWWTHVPPLPLSHRKVFIHYLCRVAYWITLQNIKSYNHYIECNSHIYTDIPPSSHVIRCEVYSSSRFQGFMPRGPFPMSTL